LKYLLDTNVCIAVMNGKSPLIERRLLKELSAGSELFVSTVATFEMWYGVAKSSRQLGNTQKLEAFVAGWVTLLPFDEEDARIAGKLRFNMEAIGRPVGAYDLLIAGQAMRHGMTLVSANAKEFGRIEDLVWEDWTKC
jgi:tRNA(fMet)-specific endonuclease VapC